MKKKEITNTEPTISVERLERSIFLIHGFKVMLRSDLARLYSVSTKTLNQSIKRNMERFPDDFMFQLDQDEISSLRSQNVTLKKGRGEHSKYAPYAFTQEGIAMLSSVLRSKRAIEVNIAIMRAFVKLRELMTIHGELAKKINEIERRHDAQFKVVFNSIRELIDAKPREATSLRQRKKAIGFGRE